MDNKILMSQIAQPHTQIMNDVDPLPAAGTGDDIHTVQLVIEYAVDIRIGQCFISGHLPAVAHHIVDILLAGNVLREQSRMIMDADIGIFCQQLRNTSLLLRFQLYYMAAGPVPVGPLKFGEILSLLQILICFVAFIGRLHFVLHCMVSFLFLIRTRLLAAPGRHCRPAP